MRYSLLAVNVAGGRKCGRWRRAPARSRFWRGGEGRWVDGWMDGSMCHMLTDSNSAANNKIEKRPCGTLCGSAWCSMRTPPHHPHDCGASRRQRTVEPTPNHTQKRREGRTLLARVAEKQGCLFLLCFTTLLFCTLCLLSLAPSPSPPSSSSSYTTSTNARVLGLLRQRSCGQKTITHRHTRTSCAR